MRLVQVIAGVQFEVSTLPRAVIIRTLLDRPRALILLRRIASPAALLTLSADRVRPEPANEGSDGLGPVAVEESREQH